MNNFPDYSKLPKYKELRLKQKECNEILNDENLFPFIFDNFLSSDELLNIYNLMKNTANDRIVLKNWSGQATINPEEKIFTLPLTKKIEQFASDAYGEELEVVDLALSKYTSDFGWEVKLHPHYDSRSTETLVFDLQIHSNHKWPLIVEGKEYDLKNGQALLFSGTNQMHWRENKTIQSGEETFLIFAWLKHKKERLYKDEYNQIMKERQKILIEETKITDKPKQIQDNIKNNIIPRTPLTHYGRYSNIFTKKQIDLIYNAIDLNSNDNTTKVKIYGQKVWFIDLPLEIKDIVTEQMKMIHNQNVKLEEISFARYSKEYSDIPILTPHYDNTFKEPRVTLDVQLNSNIDWTIVVEGNEIKLGNNEAATFSGTHQIHWRKPIEFKDGDFVEMLFCHFSLEDSKKITLDEKQEIESKMMRFSNEFSVSLMKENIQIKQAIKKYSYE
jgi:hypothetical protein